MRIETGEPNFKKEKTAGPGRGAELPAPGKRFTARVLFASGDTVNLKTEEGALVRARIESGGPLSPGQKAVLLVVEKGEDTVTLIAESVTGGEAEGPAPRGGQGLPPELSFAAAHLENAGAPATAENAALMAEVLKQSPKLTPEQAAFVAANRGVAAVLFEGARGAEAVESFMSGREPLPGLIAAAAKALASVKDAPAAPGPAPVAAAETTKSAPPALPLGEGEARRTAEEAPAPAQELRGVPERAVARAVSGLAEAEAERAALVSKAPEETAGRLGDSLKELFIRLGREENSAAEKLKKLFDLPKKMAAIKSAAETLRAASPEPAAAAGRLADRVRVTANIDRFFFAQIPIELQGAPREAELYIFKNKKGADRVDPENIKILLSLETGHMGRFESLITVRGRDVHVKIDAADKAVGGFLKGATVLLFELVGETGFRLTDLTVTAAEGLSERTTAENAMKRFLEDERRARRGLDIRV